MRAPAARQQQDTRLAPSQRVHVERKPVVGDWVLKRADELVWRPVDPMLVDLAPTKTAVAWRWVAEVVDLMTGAAEGGKDRWLPFVAPRGSKIDFHITPTSLMSASDNATDRVKMTKNSLTSRRTSAPLPAVAARPCLVESVLLKDGPL